MLETLFTETLYAGDIVYWVDCLLGHCMLDTLFTGTLYAGDIV